MNRTLYKRERRLLNLVTAAAMTLVALGTWASINGWLPIGFFAVLGTVLVVGHLTFCVTLCRRMDR